MATVILASPSFSHTFFSYSSLTSFLFNLSLDITCVPLFLPYFLPYDSIHQTSLSPPLQPTHPFLTSHPLLYNQSYSCVHIFHPSFSMCTCGLDYLRWKTMLAENNPISVTVSIRCSPFSFISSPPYFPTTPAMSL